MEIPLYDIDTRTFGVEIEMCDFDRSKVVLPDGFEWDEEEMIDNTDSYCDKRFGGEINSAPLLFNQGSIDILNGVLRQMIEAGGKISWMVDIHVHIYAGDLTVDQLKRLVMFEYCTYPYFRKYVQLQEWNERIFNSKPLISEDKYNAIKRAESITDLRRCLENSSNKGFIRYAINVAAYFVHETVEFRCFKSTENIEELKNCIEGTYKMFYYAINHTEEDFLAIRSYEQFVDNLALPTPTPTPKAPLIYQGNPYHPKDTYVSRPLGYSSKMCSALKEVLHTLKAKRVAVVNGSFFDYELNLQSDYDITIYNEDGYKHLLYEVAVLGRKIKYSGDLEWLEKFNSDDTVRQVAVALYVYKIMKVVPASNEFKKMLLDAYKQKAEESINKTESSAKRLIEMLNKAEYHFGNLDDALASERMIFFSFGKKYKHTRRAFRTISNNSDYDTMLEGKRVCYDGLVERIPADTTFLMFSGSPYFDNLHKVSYMRNAGIYRESCGLFLYSNHEINSSKTTSNYAKRGQEVSVIIPPDDLEITDPKKLKIFRVPCGQFLYLQKQFIKKVDKVSQGIFSFVIMYDKYCLGGVSFDFPRAANFDLWQLCDFCTNNNVPRLSKLILLCILSKQLQKMVSRQIGRMIKSVITYAYTDAPVSMKYRGVYKKSSELSQPHRLAYVGELGVYKTIEEIVTKYQTYIQNARR